MGRETRDRALTLETLKTKSTLELQQHELHIQNYLKLGLKCFKTKPSIEERYYFYIPGKMCLN